MSQCLCVCCSCCASDNTPPLSGEGQLMRTLNKVALTLTMTAKSKYNAQVLYLYSTIEQNKL